MRGLILITMIFISGKLLAQDTLNFRMVDTKTYDWYVAKNWDSVIEIGNRAIGQNIDYYYLRMRIGIAYYEKKKFRKAENHFTKALFFNSSSDAGKQYLYYCYLYSGQYE